MVAKVKEAFGIEIKKVRLRTSFLTT